MVLSYRVTQLAEDEALVDELVHVAPCAVLELLHGHALPRPQALVHDACTPHAHTQHASTSDLPPIRVYRWKHARQLVGSLTEVAFSQLGEDADLVAVDLEVGRAGGQCPCLALVAGHGLLELELHLGGLHPPPHVGAQLDGAVQHAVALAAEGHRAAGGAHHRGRHVLAVAAHGQRVRGGGAHGGVVCTLGRRVHG